MTTASGLGRLALARGTVDRVTERRTDKEWLDAAWADPRTRVLVVNDGHALIRLHGGDIQVRDGWSSGGQVRDGQGGAELVGRLAGEPPLPLVRFLQAVQQVVEGPTQLVQLVAGLFPIATLTQLTAMGRSRGMSRPSR